LSTTYVLEGNPPVEVTRWWNNGSFRWTLHGDTLDQMQIAQLFTLLDPVVGAALVAQLAGRPYNQTQAGALAKPPRRRGP